MRTLSDFDPADIAGLLEGASVEQKRTVVAGLERFAHCRYFPNARVKQRPPTGEWFVWLLMAGRGFGKTKTGAEWIIDRALRESGDYAVIAPTESKGRDVCIEDPTSGLLAVLARRREKPASYNRSSGELQVRLANGSRIKVVSAEKPDSVRGFNLAGAWCDELGAWRYADTWYAGLVPALRVGARPQVIVTTTPRRTPLLVDLLCRDDGSVVVTQGSTWENRANLTGSALAELEIRYANTTLGRQELEGLLLDDVEGALWQRAWIDQHRVNHMPDGLVTMVVAVDPALTASETSDETGIVAVGRSHTKMCPVCGPVDAPHAFVVADESCKESPDRWARRAVRLYEDVHADRMVAEKNAGGDLVELTIRNVESGISYKAVNATRGKELRAGPVAAVYEQGRVHHVGALPELEDQMCTWVPGDADSPDRVDALVHGITALGMWLMEPSHTSGRTAAVRRLPATGVRR